MSKLKRSSLATRKFYAECICLSCCKLDNPVTCAVCQDCGGPVAVAQGRGVDPFIMEVIRNTIEGIRLDPEKRVETLKSLGFLPPGFSASQVEEPGEKIPIAASPENDLWPMFHRLWTKAVGKEDYVKLEWMQLEALIFDKWAEHNYVNNR
jgi:hypothetical protein